MDGLTAMLKMAAKAKWISKLEQVQVEVFGAGAEEV